MPFLKNICEKIKENDCVIIEKKSLRKSSGKFSANPGKTLKKFKEDFLTTPEWNSGGIHEKITE